MSDAPGLLCKVISVSYTVPNSLPPSCLGLVDAKLLHFLLHLLLGFLCLLSGYALLTLWWGFTW